MRGKEIHFDHCPLCGRAFSATECSFANEHCIEHINLLHPMDEETTEQARERVFKRYPC